MDVDTFVDNHDFSDESQFLSAPGNPDYTSNNPASWDGAKSAVYDAIHESIKNYIKWQSVREIKNYIKRRDNWPGEDGELDNEDDLKYFLKNYAIEAPNYPKEHENFDIDNPTTYAQKIEEDAGTSAVQFANIAKPVIDVIFSQLEQRTNLGTHSAVIQIINSIKSAKPLVGSGDGGSQLYTTLMSGISKISTPSNSIDIK